MYLLTVLETRILQSVLLGCNLGIHKAMLSSEVLEKNLFFAFSQFWGLWLLAFLGMWLHHFTLQDQNLQIFLCSAFILPFPVSVCVCVESLSDFLL